MSKQPPISARAERVIDASPDVIYNLVTDLPRMPEWSPENTEVVWLDEDAAAVGSRFKGSNQLGSLKWSVKGAVTEAQQGQSFEFKINGRSGPVWRYELHPTADGTLVVETVEQAKRSPWPIRMLQRKAGVTDRSAHLRSDMETTLDNLAAASLAVTLA